MMLYAIVRYTSFCAVCNRPRARWFTFGRKILVASVAPPQEILATIRAGDIRVETRNYADNR